jgi:hypothetical protein
MARPVEHVEHDGYGRRGRGARTLASKGAPALACVRGAACAQSEAGMEADDPDALRRLSPLTLQLDEDGSLLWYVPAFGAHARRAAAAPGGARADAAGGGGGEETAAGMMSALEAVLLQSKVRRRRSALAGACAYADARTALRQAGSTRGDSQAGTRSESTRSRDSHAHSTINTHTHTHTHTHTLTHTHTCICNQASARAENRWPPKEASADSGRAQVRVTLAHTSSRMLARVQNAAM